MIEVQRVLGRHSTYETLLATMFGVLGSSLQVAQHIDGANDDFLHEMACLVHYNQTAIHFVLKASRKPGANQADVVRLLQPRCLHLAVQSCSGVD